MLVLAEMCHQTQFDLTVVRAEEQAAVVGYDRFANETSALRTDRQVLQVGVAGGQTTRGCDGLVVGGVDTSRLRIDKCGQGIDIGGQQLAYAPKFQYLVHKWMTVTQFQQDVFGGAVLAGFCFFAVNGWLARPRRVLY